MLSSVTPVAVGTQDLSIVKGSLDLECDSQRFSMDGFTNTRDIVHCSSPQNPWRGRGSLLDGELNVGRTERESTV